jgi:hypothetical protein
VKRLDPAADKARRVWTTCPDCGVKDPKGAYMLGYERSLVFAQCPRCFYRWWHDTGFGAAA